MNAAHRNVRIRPAGEAVGLPVCYKRSCDSWQRLLTYRQKEIVCACARGGGEGGREGGGEGGGGRERERARLPQPGVMSARCRATAKNSATTYSIQYIRISGIDA